MLPASLFFLRLISIVGLLVFARSSVGAEAIQRSEENLNSGGKPFSVERFAMNQPGRRPAVVFIHGADGLSNEFFLGWYRFHLEALARAGYVVFFPHYMEATGDKSGFGMAIFRSFAVWQQAVRGAMDRAAGDPAVDATHLGVAGASLGGALALTEAAADPRVKACVEFFGALPEPALRRLERMPPVLILHGDQDFLVNVREAYRLEDYFKEKGMSYEMHIYPGANHGFLGATNADAAARMIAFFQKHFR